MAERTNTNYLRYRLDSASGRSRCDYCS